ncbi:hypothetical protein A2U01_0098136, partial [Trifolium medium]|nr:hypothetical protein [Trifolium medium]
MDGTVGIHGSKIGMLIGTGG